MSLKPIPSPKVVCVYVCFPISFPFVVVAAMTNVSQFSCSVSEIQALLWCWASDMAIMLKMWGAEGYQIKVLASYYPQGLQIVLS